MAFEHQTLSGVSILKIIMIFKNHYPSACTFDFGPLKESLTESFFLNTRDICVSE